MRFFSNFLAALSLLLLLVVCFFWTRSYFRYEGVLHFSEGAPWKTTMSGAGETLDAEVTGRSSGWISYRGRLTYVSIANPLRTKPWESWSQPADAPRRAIAHREGDVAVILELAVNDAALAIHLVRDHEAAGIGWIQFTGEESETAGGLETGAEEFAVAVPARRGVPPARTHDGGDQANAAGRIDPAGGGA